MRDTYLTLGMDSYYLGSLPGARTWCPEGQGPVSGTTVEGRRGYVQ